jgi:hypothetical protein
MACPVFISSVFWQTNLIAALPLDEIVNEKAVLMTSLYMGEKPGLSHLCVCRLKA